jgi:hypothetical protein
LGMPPRHPFFIGKNQVTFNKLYFYCFMHYEFFLECLYFRFQFSFVLFAAINGWTPTNFSWRWHSIFHLPRTLRFSLLSFNECSLFLELRLAFVFCLDFYLDLVLSLHQGVFRPLVNVDFHQKSYFKKIWMVLEKRKSLMQKSGTKRSLFRLRLRLLHAMLDIVLIVCLVISAVAWFVSNDWDCLMSISIKSCVVFIICNHLFSFLLDALFGSTWRMLTTYLTLIKSP